MYTNISGRAPIINGMAIVTVNSLHCGVTYNITAQGMYNNGTVVGPESSHRNITTGLCPCKTHTCNYPCTHGYSISYQLIGRKSNPIFLAVRIPYRTHSTIC